MKKIPKLIEVKMLFNMPLEDAANKLNLTPEELIECLKYYGIKYWVINI